MPIKDSAMKLVGATLRNHVEISQAGAVGAADNCGNLHALVEVRIVILVSRSVIGDSVHSPCLLVAAHSGNDQVPTVALNSRYCRQQSQSRSINIDGGLLGKILFFVFATDGYRFRGIELEYRYY